MSFTCKRCGYCCTFLAVVIVNDATKPPVEDNVEIHNGDGKNLPCKYLEGHKPGEYSCAVHDQPWYEDSPCYQHNSMSKACFIGTHIMNGKSKTMFNHLCKETSSKEED